MMRDRLCAHRLHSRDLSSRRQFLARSGMGLGALGLASLLPDDLLAAAVGQAAPAVRATHFPAKAKHVIHIFAQGAPSQVDTWDPKPELTKANDQPLPGLNGVAMASPFTFAKYGKSGIEVSEVFSSIAKHVDDLAIIRSMQTDIPAHDVATVMMNTGSLRMAKPSVGAWALYGLGSANQNMPGYISLRPNGASPPGGSLNWGSAFLSGALQATSINTSSSTVDGMIPNIRNQYFGRDEQRRELDLVQMLNAAQQDQDTDPQLEARIQSFEMAYRMQIEATDAFDLSLAEAAAIYGKLLARTDSAWDAAFATVVGDAVLRFLPPRARNQYFQIRDQSDMLDLVDPGAPARANALVDSPTPADSPIFLRGQAESPGPIVPRRFLAVLSGSSRSAFKQGSGRLELANAIASKSNALTARVMVNRVWQHHFGDGFVSTPDDLGNQSSAPTHPDLLDWLATRFMADNWSVKKLHKQILLSATWQQSSRNKTPFAVKDPFNRLLWRANVRRLEFEPLRDSILAIGGGLDLTMGGHPVDLTAGESAPRGRGGLQLVRDTGLRLSTEPRRTIYGFVDRGDVAEVLNAFDFPSPDTPSGKRYETMVPQQALFLMNSPLVIEQVRAVVNREAFQQAASDEARIRMLYELYFQREPTAKEMTAGREFVGAFQEGASPPAASSPAGAGPGGARGARGGGQGRGRGGFGRAGGTPAPVRTPLSAWQEFAHALLMTNEAAFVN